ncbi:MFS transporter [Azohydromonas sediminis]|uniref:MFS transporter n=1 Tax=Azohydromonas sediminis TaxID=2259674 RepID=UPI001F269349|nr:MFS transporter [Azohydromonas sediminis]
MSGTAAATPAVATRTAATIFVGFAFAYFFSALLRAVMATLAPAFSAELGLGAGDLGLLAGAYFLGFAALQLPLGSALDRHGPKRVLLAFLAVAVLACAAFALARSFAGLLVARTLIGVGVAACLMAPLTSFRHRFTPALQLRANSWMLMTGSLGMLASTVPVQALLPLLGWRGLFWVLAALLAVSMAVIAWGVPRDERAAAENEGPGSRGGYRDIFRHPMFVRLLPMGFVHYGGLVAVQSLWAGPWLTQVAGHTPQAAARGLFAINLSMLVAFLAWGLVMPRLLRAGWHAQRLITAGVPVSLALLVVVVALGERSGATAWALWCVSCTVVSLAQPAIGQAFDTARAGRALSAYNLVIFGGVFCVQWGIGLLIDLLRALGWAPLASFQAAFAVFAVLCVASYLWFLALGGRVAPAGTAARPS